MKGRAKAVPRLRSEAAERRFWERRDSTPFVDWSKAQRVTLPALKPTTRILIKIWLEEKLSA